MPRIVCYGCRGNPRMRTQNPVIIFFLFPPRLSSPALLSLSLPPTREAAQIWRGSGRSLDTRTHTHGAFAEETTAARQA